jgi:hypothetical protein
MTPMSPYETGDIKSASGTPSPPTVCNNTLTNFLSIQTNSTSDTLASLQNVVFRSDDYIISDLLCQRMHEDHDPELIKTESNELQDTIFDNPRAVLANTLFPKHVFASSNDARPKFYANIHFGKTNNPNDGSLYNHMQLRHFMQLNAVTYPKVPDSLSFGSNTSWFSQLLSRLPKIGPQFNLKTKSHRIDKLALQDNEQTLTRFRHQDTTALHDLFQPSFRHRSLLCLPLPLQRQHHLLLLQLPVQLLLPPTSRLPLYLQRRHRSFNI